MRKGGIKNPLFVTVFIGTWNETLQGCFPAEPWWRILPVTCQAAGIRAANRAQDQLTTPLKRVCRPDLGCKPGTGLQLFA